jgi:hypothetical protein
MDPYDPYPFMMEKSKKDDDLADKQLLSDLENILHRPEGMRFIAWILAEAHILHHGYTGHPTSGAFVAGERSLGGKVLKQVRRVKPRYFAELLDKIQGD